MDKTATIDTDVTKEPFRVFVDMSPKWVVLDKEGVDMSFFVKPMNSPERAVFNASDRALNASLDYVGAYKRAGLTKEEVHDIPSELGDVKDLEGEELTKRCEEIQKWSDESNEKWALVTAKLTTDLGVQKQFAEVSRSTVVECVELVKIKGEDREFTFDMYEQIQDEEIKVWLLKVIKNVVNLTDGERVGL